MYSGCFAATTRATLRPSNRGINAGHPSVAAAEWFSGLPLQWTSIEGEVCKQTFVQMFPRATSKARFDFFIITEHAISLWPMQEGKMPLISLFSGCGALELGLSELEPH